MRSASIHQINTERVFFWYDPGKESCLLTKWQTLSESLCCVPAAADAMSSQSQTTLKASFQANTS